MNFALFSSLTSAKLFFRPLLSKNLKSGSNAMRSDYFSSSTKRLYFSLEPIAHSLERDGAVCSINRLRYTLSPGQTEPFSIV